MKNKSIFTLIIVFGVAISAFFVSVPSGLTQSGDDWTDPINLSNSGASTNPLIVVDTDDVIHVIWEDEFDGYKYVESANGVNWTDPVTVNFPFSPEDTLPRFEITPNGVIHAFWEDDENTLYYAQVLQANMSSPVSWRLFVRLGVSVVDYDVATDELGNLYVSYIKNEASDSEPSGVYHRRSTNGGGSWSGVQQLFDSPYFRSLSAEDAHIRIAVSGLVDLENVYVVWDDAALNRIFLAKSVDLGKTWSEAEQIKEPDEFTGYQTPFNAEIYTIGETGLLSWQVGETRNQCFMYNQVLLNKGEELGEITKLPSENIGCPDNIDFLPLNQEISLLLVNIQGGVYLMAWNGSEWSDLKLQNQLLDFYNPVTFDPIELDCQQYSLHKNTLYMIGCDQGNSGDIWFTSLSIDSLENWFPLSSNWSLTGLITNTDQVISSLSSVAYLDNVHVFWVQSARTSLDNNNSSIQYSRRDNKSWSDPRVIISNLSGKPRQITVATDSDGRILLAWIDGNDGSIYFSWAASEGAGNSSEWIPPEIIPSVSQLSSSPDMLVDASGRIIVAYAIPVNENRGIYMVQSTDLGNSWSSPTRVFDAVSAGWEMVDDPRFSLGEDGRIHLLFNEYSVRNNYQPVGMYYAHSSDGGITWNDLEVVSKGPVTWSAIYGLNNKEVHRIWQDDNGLIAQRSIDDGETWAAPVKIINEQRILTSLAFNHLGALHLSILSFGKETTLQDWEWDGVNWVGKEKIDLDLKGTDTHYLTTLNITPNGNLVGTILFNESDLTSERRSEIWGVSRLLEITETSESLFSPVVPTPESFVPVFETPDVLPTLSGEEFSSPLINVNEPSSVNRKNLVGYILVVVVLALTVVVIWPKRKK